MKRPVHPDPEQLAAWIEGGLAAAEASRVEQHVLSCRQCLTAYADLLVFRREVPARSGVGEDDAELLTAALGGRGDQDRRAAEPTTASRRRPGRPRPRVAWSAAAALAVALVGGWWFVAGGPPRAGSDGTAGETWLAAAASAVREASRDGLILPGQARRAYPDRPTLRASRADSGVFAGDGALHTDPPAAHTEQALLHASGLLAAGQHDMARLVIGRALRERPDHPDWLLLAADLAYRGNDLVRADSLLTRAFAARPDAPEIRFGLGLVRKARGDHASARELLEGLLQPEDGSLVSMRARQELREESAGTPAEWTGP